MQQKPLFGANEFKQALKEQSDKVLSDTRQKQEDAKPKPMNKNVERDYNIVIVMRHSKRIDQHHSKYLKWDEKDEYMRPYDPPIVDYKLPIEKMKEIQSFIPNINITKIIISPYLRCIQTGAIIGKYLNIKTFEIDARLGENSLAVNRCIKHAKNKQNVNKKINYNIPNDYKDVTYLTMNQIKTIMVDLYNNNSDKNEEKNNIVENDFNVEWKHYEKAGNHLHVECVKEYKNLLIKQQQSKQKDMIRNDYLMISHGQVLSDISEDLCGKILTVDECGWICVTHNESAKLYSPTSIQILYDANASM